VHGFWLVLLYFGVRERLLFALEKCPFFQKENHGSSSSSSSVKKKYVCGVCVDLFWTGVSVQKQKNNIVVVVSYTWCCGRRRDIKRRQRRRDFNFTTDNFSFSPNGLISNSWMCSWTFQWQLFREYSKVFFKFLRSRRSVLFTRQNL